MTNGNYYSLGLKKSNSDYLHNTNKYIPQHALQMYIQDNNYETTTAKRALSDIYDAPAERYGSILSTQNYGFSKNNSDIHEKSIFPDNQQNNNQDEYENQSKFAGISNDTIQNCDQEKIKLLLAKNYLKAFVNKYKNSSY